MDWNKFNIPIDEKYFIELRRGLLEYLDTHYVNLFNRISYTHFVELIRVDEPLKRLFYELECVNGAWSVKELKRQIGSLLYERTGLSQNKEKLLAMAQATPGKRVLQI